MKTIHPFPARMAPEIALNSIKELRSGSTVLDPMMGSGTTIKMGLLHNHDCIGVDMDPLAVLLSKVWNTSIDTSILEKEALNIVEEAKLLKAVSVPWIDENKETSDFINFWFVEPQKNDLRKLSSLLYAMDSDISDALRIILSKLIIKKDKGASLGRDISHSRPHKVRDTNDYDIFTNFARAAKQVVNTLEDEYTRGKVTIKLGDARNLEGIKNDSIDYIITSPPYLHAVDYMRAHKLSLVWLGYNIETLRDIRSNTIGIEKKLANNDFDTYISDLLKGVDPIVKLPERRQLFIHRYAVDLLMICMEFSRVLKREGKATVVIADSYISSNLIRNTQIFKNAAEIANLEVTDEMERKIPANRRYLPPPDKAGSNDLSKRMKTEAVITFYKP